MIATPKVPLRVLLFFVAATAVLATPLWLGSTSWAATSSGTVSGGGCDGGLK